jgi:Flp pilus assembly protein TadG
MSDITLGLSRMRSAGRRRLQAYHGGSKQRRGGAVLETALVMGVLIMLSFGTAEYGYFFFVKNILAGAARDGVRAAIPSSAANSDVLSAIGTAMTAAHIPSTQYTVTLSPTDISTATTGTAVSVTITCSWGTVGVTPLPVSMGGIPTTKQVTAVAVMRKES